MSNLILSSKIAFTPLQLEFKHKIERRWLFCLFTLTKVPMLWLAGVKLIKLDEEECEMSVPYKWLNRNPFDSTYFAVLSMAAEASTGLPALVAAQAEQKVSTLVVAMEASFKKKATGLTRFVCRDVQKLLGAAQQTLTTGEAARVDAVATGYANDGAEVARFVIQWSMKRKSQ